MVRLGGTDYLVVHVVTSSRFSLQQPALVAVHKFGNLCYAAVGDVPRSETEVPCAPRPQAREAHRPSAAEVLVKPGHESLDPVRDGAKRP
jgi:hypothetical protein